MVLSAASYLSKQRLPSAGFCRWEEITQKEECWFHPCAAMGWVVGQEPLEGP